MMNSLFHGPGGRIRGGLATIALGALLAACSADGSAAGSATTPAGPTATPTTPPLATASLATQPDVTTVCDGLYSSSGFHVYAFGPHLYGEVAFALSYPSYTVPAGTPNAPFKLGSDLGSAALDPVFGGPASANPSVADPDGILFTLCNHGSAPVIVAGVSMGVTALAPHASPIDTWQGCDGAYQVGAQGMVGGCGGAVQADEVMHASFAPSAGLNASTGVSMVNATGYNGYGAIPVTLPPGKSLSITVSVTMPTAPGIYTLALSVAGTDISTAVYAPLAPQVFATVAHKWNGQNCLAPGMKGQIPINDTTDYFICP